MELLRKNYHIPDQLTLVDNTVRPTVVLVVEQGRIIWQAPGLPKWAAEVEAYIRQVERTNGPNE